MHFRILFETLHDSVAREMDTSEATSYLQKRLSQILHSRTKIEKVFQKLTPISKQSRQNPIRVL